MIYLLSELSINPLRDTYWEICRIIGTNGQLTSLSLTVHQISLPHLIAIPNWLNAFKLSRGGEGRGGEGGEAGYWLRVSEYYWRGVAAGLNCRKSPDWLRGSLGHWARWLWLPLTLKQISAISPSYQGQPPAELLTERFKFKYFFKVQISSPSFKLTALNNKIRELIWRLGTVWRKEAGLKYQISSLNYCLGSQLNVSIFFLLTLLINVFSGINIFHIPWDLLEKHTS